MFQADIRICRDTRVRLLDRLESYGVGGGTTPGRCKGVLRREGGAVFFVGQVCNAVVMPCDLRRLEMAPLA